MDNRQYFNSVCVKDIIDRVWKTSNLRATNFVMHSRIHPRITPYPRKDILYGRNEFLAQIFAPRLIPMIRIRQIQFGFRA